MTLPSTSLYATATAADREALHYQHQADPQYPRACARWCARCRLEAKARLFGRAGDAAVAVRADEISAGLVPARREP